LAGFGASLRGKFLEQTADYTDFTASERSCQLVSPSVECELSATRTLLIATLTPKTYESAFFKSPKQSAAMQGGRLRD